MGRPPPPLNAAEAAAAKAQAPPVPAGPSPSAGAAGTIYGPQAGAGGLVAGRPPVPLTTPPLPAGAPLPAAAANALAAVTAAAATVSGEGGPATKPHRELYIGNLPPGITSAQLTEFVNAAFTQLGLAKDKTQPVVVASWVSPDGHYAFVELRSMEDATNALASLNGVQVGSYALRIGRPKGYTGPANAQAVNPLLAGLNMNLGLAEAGAGGAAGAGLGLAGGLGMGMGMGMGVPAIPGVVVLSNAVLVSNLPAQIGEAEIKELFTPFGKLSAFNVIRGVGGSNEGPQSAALEFADAAVVDGVVAGMNNLDVAGHKLSVQRIPAASAAVLLQPVAASTTSTGAAAPNPAAGPGAAPGEAAKEEDVPESLLALPVSSTLCLLNLATAAEVADEELYDELLEDVADECNAHGGTVRAVHIPRSSSSGSSSSSHSSSSSSNANGSSDGGPGAEEGGGGELVRVFVQFTDAAGAQATRGKVEGRKFNGRTVRAFFFPDELLAQKVFSVPTGYGATTETGGEAENQEQVADEGKEEEEAEAYVPEDLEDLD